MLFYRLSQRLVLKLRHDVGPDIRRVVYRQPRGCSRCNRRLPGQQRDPHFVRTRRDNYPLAQAKLFDLTPQCKLLWNVYADIGCIFLRQNQIVQHTIGHQFESSPIDGVVPPADFEIFIQCFWPELASNFVQLRSDIVVAQSFDSIDELRV